MALILWVMRTGILLCLLSVVLCVLGALEFYRHPMIGAAALLLSGAHSYTGVGHLLDHWKEYRDIS